MKRNLLPILIMIFFAGCPQSVDLAQKVKLSGTARTGLENPISDLAKADTTIFYPGDVEVYNRLGELIATSTTDSNGNFAVTVFNGIDFFIKITNPVDKRVVSAYIDKIEKGGKSGVLVNTYTTSLVYSMQNHLGVSLLGRLNDYAIIGYPGLLNLKNVSVLIEEHVQFPIFIEQVHIHVLEGKTGSTLPEDIKRVMRTIEIDTAPPINRTVPDFIARGDEVTTTLSVIIDISATDDVSLDSFFASEDPEEPAIDDPAWALLNTLDDFIGSGTFTLSTGDGIKTVYIWFKDSTGNLSLPVSDTILLEEIVSSDDGPDRNNSKPDVIATNPTRNEEDVIVNSFITIEFDMAMAEDNSLDVFKIIPDVNGEFSWINNNTTLKFVPNINLEYNEQYTIVILGKITNLLGTNMGTFYSFSFTTGQIEDINPPEIVETIPVIGSSRVGTKSNILIRFDEAVESNSVNNTTFTLTGPDGDLPGTITLDNKSVFFTPDSRLLNSTSYTVTLTDTIIDMSGNSFAGTSFDFTTIDSNNSIIDINAGGDHTCVVFDSGKVKCWGSNNFGQLGQSDQNFRGDEPEEMGINLASIDLGIGSEALSISTGGSHTCAALKGGKLICWGDNSKGQLGIAEKILSIGDKSPSMAIEVDFGSQRQLFGISSGGRHVCIVDSNGNTKCWGWNGAGQLGSGESTDIGRNASDMGDLLNFVSFRAGSAIFKIFSGYSHNCAIFKNGSLKCWGANLDGQLGLEHKASLGNASAQMGDFLPFVNLGTDRSAVDIAIGSSHTCSLLDNGTVKCWGWNGKGQSGLEDTLSRGDNVNEMGDNLPIVNLGTDVTALSITAGANHTCALLTDNTVKCWGDNALGQLGLGDTNNRGGATGEMGDNLPPVELGSNVTVISITAGANHTCALLEGNIVKCWGKNEVGQLGLGDTDKRGDNADEMGDNLNQVSL